MSKQADAKVAQKYSPNPMQPTCGNCANFRAERVLPEWMAIANAGRVHLLYAVEKYGIEKNLRCGIGGFAIKKLGSCDLFVARGAQ